MATESKSVSGSFLFKLFWWIVLRLNPQWAHRLMYFGLKDGSFGRMKITDPELALTVWGHKFNMPVGIAGGVDKKGNIIDRLIQIGYGFGTFGPYTLEKEMPVKQTYYFRKERSILVQCLGFRNPGVLKTLPWFVKRRYLPNFIGIDLAIPAETEDQNIKQGRHFTYQEEFVLMAQKVAPYCDFITLDLSHPNSELSMLVVDPSTVVPMVKAVKEAVRVAAPIQTPPVLVKIPLDINTKELPLVARNLLDSGADGVVVAGPLSLSKNSLLQLPGRKDEHVGMLYGSLVREHVVNLIRQLYEATKGQVPIIGCGGVFTAEDALEQFKAGATMIQIDNASLTFAGPTCVLDIHKGLLRLMKEQHFENIEHVIGYDVREKIMAQAPENVPAQPKETVAQITPVAEPVQQQVQVQQPVVEPVQQPTQPQQPISEPAQQPTPPQKPVSSAAMAPMAPPAAPLTTPTPEPPTMPPKQS